VRVAKKCAERHYVRLEALGPEIPSQKVASIFNVPNEPGQHVFECGRLVHLPFKLAKLRDYSFFVRRGIVTPKDRRQAMICCFIFLYICANIARWLFSYAVKTTRNGTDH